MYAGDHQIGFLNCQNFGHRMYKPSSYDPQMRLLIKMLIKVNATISA